ncbi:MAG: universal stress protein [Flavobacterium sp.]|uniref:universal stress protein n=1 Tax=Flavobacterium sp. TaxID=239 RepID=UPI0037BC59D0
MKKILFPTDFSEAANSVFVHALELAKIVNGEIILLHSFELPTLDNQFFPQNYEAVFESVTLSEYGMFKDEVPKLRAIAAERNLENIKLSHRLIQGDVIDCIKQAVAEDAIDFVVMGTSGATGWKELFLGSKTGDVLAAINVPVLSVPFGANYAQIETIGFTTRFREKDKDALKKVIGIAKKTKAKVKCLYVKTNTSDVKEATVTEWKNEFINEPVQFFIIPSEDIEETILDFIDNQNIDVLAMLTYKKSFFTDLFTTGFAKKMSYSTAIPVLVLYE